MREQKNTLVVTQEGDSMSELYKPKSGGLVGRFLRDERGTSAIEYAIIVSGVSIFIVGTVATLGTAVKGFL